MTEGGATLTEAEREALLDVAYAYANPFDDDSPTPEWLGVVATVERILADRLAAVQAERDEWERLSVAATLVAHDARRRLAEVEALAERPHMDGQCVDVADLRAALANPPAE